MATSNGWQTAHRAADEEALLVAGMKVKGRFNPSQQDLLWLNIKLADGGWTYVVLDRASGKMRVLTYDRTKRRCWEKARDALASQS